MNNFLCQHSDTQKNVNRVFFNIHLTYPGKLISPLYIFLLLAVDKL